MEGSGGALGVPGVPWGSQGCFGVPMGHPGSVLGSLVVFWVSWGCYRGTKAVTGIPGVLGASYEEGPRDVLGVLECHVGPRGVKGDPKGAITHPPSLRVAPKPCTPPAWHPCTCALWHSCSHASMHLCTLAPL